MKVNVRFFASLKESTGTGGCAIELPAGADFDALCAAIAKRLGESALTALQAPSVRVAHNQSFATPPFMLADGDEIAFMPPVTGG